MPAEPLVVVDVSLDSDGLLGCMIVENNVSSLGLRQIGFCQTIPKYFEEVDYIVLIRGLCKEEDWFGGLGPDRSEHRDVMRPLDGNCEFQWFKLILPAFDWLLLGVEGRLVDVEHPVLQIR